MSSVANQRAAFVIKRCRFILKRYMHSQWARKNIYILNVSNKNTWFKNQTGPCAHKEVCSLHVHVSFSLQVLLKRFNEFSALCLHIFLQHRVTIVTWLGIRRARATSDWQFVVTPATVQLVSDLQNTRFLLQRLLSQLPYFSRVLLFQPPKVVV